MFIPDRKRILEQRMEQELLYEARKDVFNSSVEALKKFNTEERTKIEHALNTKESPLNQVEEHILFILGCPFLFKE